MNNEEKDIGIELVREFHQVFGAHIGQEPKIPDYQEGFTKAILQTLKSEMHLIASNLQKFAAIASQIEDHEGSLVLIRLQLIQEELAELAEAFADRDIVEAFDALEDLSYVVDGTFLTLGLGDKKIAGYREVHASNMSKLDENGKPVISESGRVMKGPNYFRPRLAEILDK